MTTYMYAYIWDINIIFICCVGRDFTVQPQTTVLSLAKKSDSVFLFLFYFIFFNFNRKTKKKTYISD